MEKVSKILTSHLAKVTEKVERIVNSEGQIPRIEADMLMQALREMYDAAYTALNTTATPQPAAVVDKAAATEEPLHDNTNDDASLAPLMMDIDAEPQYADDDSIAPVDKEHTVETLEGREYDDLFADTEEPAPTDEVTPAMEEAPVAMAEEKIVEEAEPVAENAPVEEEAPIAEHTPTEETVPAADEAPVAETLPETETNTIEPTEPAPSTTNEKPATVTPAAATATEPKTLWDKLQEQHTSPTLGEQQAGKSIFDQLTEKAKSSMVGVAATEATIVKAHAEEASNEIAAPTAQPAAPAPTPAPEEVHPAPAQEATPQPARQQSSLFDMLSNNGTREQQPATRTLGDNLGIAHQGGIDNKLNNNKVNDLRTVININDKFMFMNELFRNNMKGYNDFIMQLNAITNRDEALRHVEAVAEQYGWDNESLAVQTFFKVFDRKF